jgi:hypothetical protein
MPKLIAKSYPNRSERHTYEETKFCEPLLLCLAASSALDLCKWETSTHPKEPWRHTHRSAEQVTAPNHVHQKWPHTHAHYLLAWKVVLNIEN